MCAFGTKAKREKAKIFPFNDRSRCAFVGCVEEKTFAFFSLPIFAPDVFPYTNIGKWIESRL
jgi:hypothetical protein